MTRRPRPAHARGQVLSDCEGRASRDSVEDRPPPCGRSPPNGAAYPAPDGSPRVPVEVRGPPAVCQGPSVCARLEATIGFEPMNKGFANPRVRPLRHVARYARHPRVPVVRLAAPRGFEPRLTDPKSAVLPLDEGAAGPSVELDAGRNGAEDGTRTRDPHLGKVMLYQLSHFRSMTEKELVPRARFELATPRFSVACSTN